MIVRDTCIIAAVFVLAPTIASTQVVRPANKNAVPNEGTGPHDPALQSGMSVHVVDAFAAPAAKVSVGMLGVASKIRGLPAADLNSLVRGLNEASIQATQLRADASSLEEGIRQSMRSEFDELWAMASQDEVGKRRPEPKGLSGAIEAVKCLSRGVDDLQKDINKQIQDCADDAQSAIAGTDAAPGIEAAGIEAAEAIFVENAPKLDFSKALERESNRALKEEAEFSEDVTTALGSNYANLLRQTAEKGDGGLKLGSVFESGVTYGFAALTYSPGEWGAGDAGGFRHAIFGSVAEISQLGSSGGAPIARFGGGVLGGDPKHSVSAVSIASYSSPSLTDAQAGMSWKLGGQSEATLGPTTFKDGYEKLAWNEWVANREPHLMDSIRSGDLWFSANVRFLSSPDPSYTGTAGVGELTYAFRRRAFDPSRVQNPNAATTLSFEGTYCSQDNLALNEFGLEFRTPLYLDFKGSEPIYFSVRYGSRVDCTVAIETSF